MIPLVIWVVLVGYTMAWTGRQNLGLSYRPQPDGSLQVQDQSGKPSRTWTFLDAATCAQQGSGEQAQPGVTSGGAPPASRPGGLPAPNLLPVPLPNVPLPNPATIPIPQLPRLPRPPVPGLVDEVAREVHRLLEPFVRGLETIRPPRLPGFGHPVLP